MGLDDNGGAATLEAEAPAPESKSPAGKVVSMERKDSGSDELVAGAAAGAMAEAIKAAAAAADDSKSVRPRRFTIATDESRDALLTDFGKETLTDRYLLPGENFQDLFARVADCYADDEAHAQRLYDYISRLWFMPATPVLSNGGTNRGLPISCYLNSVSDSLEGIVGTWNENVWLASRGGSVQHLDFLSPEEKAAYKTSFEIDQRWLLEFAADRTPFIDQAQSLNLFIPADVDKWDLAMLHFQAWEKGIKSLYYLRSKSVQRAGFAGGVEADNTADAPKYELAAEQTDYEECLACQ